LDPDQEAIVDIDGEIYEPVITLGRVTELKQRIETKNLLIPDQVRTFVKHFTIDSTFPFPEFIHWSASNISSAKRVIMNFDGSNVLCQINLQSIREALRLSESNEEESVQFDEKESIRSFRESSPEQKVEC
jgi:hypothetical protein